MNKKYLLLAKNSQDNKKEIENVELPVTFSGNGHRLRNYRIYGNTVNGESVGDIVTEGEHSGEYLLPVTVQGEPYHEPITTNIYLPEPLRKIGDEAEYIDFREQKQYRVRENLFDKSHFTQTKFVPNNNILYEDPYTISIILSCTPNTKYTISKIVTNRFRIWGCTDYPDVGVQSRLIASGNDNSSLTFTTGNNDNYLLVMIFYQRQADEPTVDDVKNSLIYELYIYTKPDISLPAIPTIDGTNIITVATETQPSKVYLQGNITVVEAPTQSLQASPQTIDLQPLSLDVVEKPDLQLEESEQEENIIETTGGVENAE